MLEIKIIEKRPSTWGSPCCTFTKKTDRPRFCLDYRRTPNRHILRESWPLPGMEGCLDAVGGASLITVVDVTSVFCQLPVARKDVDSTAFVTHHGYFSTPCRLYLAIWVLILGFFVTLIISSALALHLKRILNR